MLACCREQPGLCWAPKDCVVGKHCRARPLLGKCLTERVPLMHGHARHVLAQSCPAAEHAASTLSLRNQLSASLGSANARP